MVASKTKSPLKNKAVDVPPVAHIYQFGMVEFVEANAIEGGCDEAESSN